MNMAMPARGVVGACAPRRAKKSYSSAGTWKSSSISTSIRTVDRARFRDVFISLSDLHLDGLSAAALERRLHFESVGQYVDSRRTAIGSHVMYFQSASWQIVWHAMHRKTTIYVGK